MGSNYNDIIDIILTLINDSEIQDSILISGSIVPYLILNQESKENHTDFYILVKSKKIDIVRSKLHKMSREYAFDITSDSKKISGIDHGFKIKYESTIVGFFPYTLIDNNLTIKTYSIDKDNMQIKLKTKYIPNITKNMVIRSTHFSDNKIRIISPEFILIEKEMRERQTGNPTTETLRLLSKISDESVLEVLRKSISSTKVDIETKPLNKKDITWYIMPIVGLIILLLLAYICFKK